MRCVLQTRMEQRRVWQKFRFWPVQRRRFQWYGWCFGLINKSMRIGTNKIDVKQRQQEKTPRKLLRSKATTRLQRKQARVYAETRPKKSGARATM